MSKGDPIGPPFLVMMLHVELDLPSAHPHMFMGSFRFSHAVLAKK